MSNCNVWDCLAYVLDPKFHKSGVKITTWDYMSLRGVNMGFSKMYSIQVGQV